MIEKKSHTSLLADKLIKKVTDLNPKEGIDYAQWGLMRTIIGSDCPYPQWEEKRNQKTLKKQQTFWLEKPGENQRISPVYGLMDKEEK